MQEENEESRFLLNYLDGQNEFHHGVHRKKREGMDKGLVGKGLGGGGGVTGRGACDF